jgi:hypothetical protein
MSEEQGVSGTDHAAENPSAARGGLLRIIAGLFAVVGVAGILRGLWPFIQPGAAAEAAGLGREGFAELGPPLASSLAALAGGIGLFRGRRWASWLLVAWMVFHIGLSALHSWQELLIHVAIFAPVGYVLFRFGRSSKAAA